MSFSQGYVLQVLQVTTAKLLVRNNLNLSLTSLADLDDITKVTGTSLDLDAVVEELLEGGGVEDLVVDGLRAVDDVLLYTQYFVRSKIRHEFIRSLFFSFKMGVMDMCMSIPS